jgi:elongation factor 1-alpha
MKRGMVTCDNKNDPQKKTKNFTAQVIITNHPGVIHSGNRPDLDCYAAHIQ